MKNTRLDSKLIDCNAQPFIPKGWRVEMHIPSGMWEWNQNIPFYLSEEQKKGKNDNNFSCSTGNDLRKELENKPVLNANVLDYLLKHQELIPESWKNQSTFFWGTIYCYTNGYLCVRCLDWVANQWCWGYRYLSHVFYGANPAALSI